ncbi:hypothetical protein [Candidatus Caldatribacterium sp.]|uniref:hypothetical protein n=1 Tax=Candidatus Caldatribacterium sp. TaxID=2282143 RepID=UPI0038474628|nr:hypothetical protein [Candidatus Caldatribacterium sp.]
MSEVILMRGPGPGSGRFKRLVNKLMKQGYSEESARKIAATIGRKKYGAKQMAKWAAEGRRRKLRMKRGR